MTHSIGNSTNVTHPVLSLSGASTGVTVGISIGLLIAMMLLSGCRSEPPPSGGAVSGSLYYQAAAEEFSTGARFFLPDIEVFLHHKASGNTSAVVTTDLFGRYRFPHQPPGSYELRWKDQLGWAAGQHPDAIVISSGPRFPVPVNVRPGKTSGVIFGTVSLGDGETPWSFDETFGVNHTAEVTILNAARTVTLAGPVHTNALGGYAAAGLPRAQPTTIRVQSQAATISRAVGPASVSVGNPVSPTNVQLANKRPEIISLVSRVSGALVKTAAPGDTITLVAGTRDLNGDPLQHEWKAMTSHGVLTPTTTGSASWQLPNQTGRFTAYLQVSDGRGGFARQQVEFETGRTETTFSGIAVDKTSGAPVTGADVVVNSQTTTTNGDGFFRVKTPLTDRYVLNIAREGFASFSRVVDSGLTGQTWPMVRTQAQSVDPTGPIDLVDRRPELERQEVRGTRIHVPADALIAPDGTAPTGMLTAHIATLNIADGEAPGDWGAMLGGRETNLISYGATFVEFRDGSGIKYNLRPGIQAEVEAFSPPAMATGAPTTTRLWSYDEKDGYWKASGNAEFSAASGSFTGKVEHFSTINTDLEKDDAACLKVMLYPPISTGVKLRVTEPTGTVFSQAFEFVLDAAINGVYRLPANTDVQLDLFRADNSAYPGLLLEEEPGIPLAGNIVNTGPPIPSGQTLWPPEPYETCKLVILREANEPTSNAFLAFKGIGSDAQAQGYYNAIDPDEDGDGVGERTTLGDWWSKNGFVFDASGVPTNAVRTSYLNFNDLGSGRDMYFLQRPDGTVAAYVTNYGDFNQDHGNADLAANRESPGATVAMEYGPVFGQGTTRIVKFFVYAGGDFAANAPRVTSADLDGFGAKFVPNLCLNCHGGDYGPADPAAPSFADLNAGAVFRELDIATYRFPGGRLVANSAEKAAFKSQNEIVRGASATDTITIQPIKDLITGWYPGASNDQDNSFRPSGWAGVPQQTLYDDVVKHSCRTCHVGLDADPSDGGIGFFTYGQLEGRQAFMDNFVLCAGRYMPHAVVTYRNFWLSASPHRPAVLRDFSNGSGWPPIGPCE